MNKQRRRALLIEDDPADYQLINRSLCRSRTSFGLIWEQNLEAGLARLDGGGIDVVLTDLSLPDSFGLETVERIRQHNQDVPIVVLTTLDDEHIELSSLSVGAQDYLIKDEATAHTLERAIHHAIQRQESIVENQRLLAEVESNHQLLTAQKALLKTKNQRLRRLYATAHRFVDNVSHEFRTPLTVIKDYVSLVREGMVGEVNAEQCRMLDVANVRADDLNNMVDDMLDLSKLESGLLGAWRRPCHLADITESVCPPLAKKGAVKEIDFSIDVDRALSAIHCDAEKVGRVIINLVTNAMKFCGTPGSVHLWAREETARGEIVIGVTDNGPGIDEEGLSEIFNRFKQLKSPLTSSAKGFGLGLNIAKELVDLNFGEMSVESQRGQGSTFSFTVPLDDPRGIMTRYVNRIQRLKNSESAAALVCATIDDGINPADAEDADVFFNYLLRRDDLIFRAGTRQWIFVLSIPQSELEEFIPRAKRDWTKTNRNRPFGPLPKFEMAIEGLWNVETESDTIQEVFSQVLKRTVGSNPCDIPQQAVGRR